MFLYWCTYIALFFASHTKPIVIDYVRVNSSLSVDHLSTALEKRNSPSADLKMMIQGNEFQ